MELQKLVDKAGEMAMSNNWGEKALKINMAILKIDHNNCAAYTRLAKYYKVNENIAEAKNMYLKALDIDPTNRGAMNNLNDFERDEKESEDVDKIKTTNELLKEAQKSMLKGRYKLASKMYLKAYSIEPLLVHAVNLASAYKEMGRYDSIEKLYKQLIDQNHIPADAEAIKNEFKTFGINELN
ncbi:MAG: tetratricopeptide repeat protein [Ruminiclostridium sp.]